MLDSTLVVPARVRLLGSCDDQGHGATWGTGDLTTSSKTYTVSTCEAACRNNSLCDAVTVGVPKTGRPACIPAEGDCAGVQNATAEYIHVSTTVPV